MISEQIKCQVLIHTIAYLAILCYAVDHLLSSVTRVMTVLLFVCYNTVIRKRIKVSRFTSTHYNILCFMGSMPNL